MGRGRPAAGGLRRGILGVCAIAAASATHLSMDTRSRDYEKVRVLPSTAQARVSVLGFAAVVADFYWLQALNVVGSLRGDVDSQEPRIGGLIELVTGLDPWVDHPYRFAAIWLNDGSENVQRANRLLEKAVAYHPLDWRNRHYLGFNHFYHLGDQLRAAEVLETAIGLEGAPHYLGPLVAKLRAGAGSLDAAEALLVGLVNTTPDEYAKARYLKSLDEIETERHARFLDEARVEFWRRHGRDLVGVEDLLRPPAPVLRRLPPAHPHFPGFGWTLDPETDQITSTFYGSRYRLFNHTRDAKRLERWRQGSQPAAPGQASETRASGARSEPKASGVHSDRPQASGVHSG